MEILVAVAVFVVVTFLFYREVKKVQRRTKANRTALTGLRFYNKDEISRLTNLADVQSEINKTNAVRLAQLYSNNLSLEDRIMKLEFTKPKIKKKATKKKVTKKKVSKKKVAKKKVSKK